MRYFLTILIIFSVTGILSAMYQGKLMRDAENTGIIRCSKGKCEIDPEGDGTYSPIKEIGKDNGWTDNREFLEALIYASKQPIKVHSSQGTPLERNKIQGAMEAALDVLDGEMGDNELDQAALDDYIAVIKEELIRLNAKDHTHAIALRIRAFKTLIKKQKTESSGLVTLDTEPQLTSMLIELSRLGYHFFAKDSYYYLPTLKKDGTPLYTRYVYSEDFSFFGSGKLRMITFKETVHLKLPHIRDPLLILRLAFHPNGAIERITTPTQTFFSTSVPYGDGSTISKKVSDVSYHEDQSIKSVQFKDPETILLPSKEKVSASAATYDHQGRVVEATLATPITVILPGAAPFLSKTIILNSAGVIIKALPEHDVEILLPTDPPTKAIAKEKEAISFSDTGALLSATLKDEVSIPIPALNKKSFKPGTLSISVNEVIAFDHNKDLRKITLTTPAPLCLPGGHIATTPAMVSFHETGAISEYNSQSAIVYPVPGLAQNIQVSALGFYRSGVLRSASFPDARKITLPNTGRDTVSATHMNFYETKKIHSVFIAENIYSSRGASMTLTLPNRQKVAARCNTLVTLSSGGTVTSCTLAEDIELVLKKYGKVTVRGKIFFKDNGLPVSVNLAKGISISLEGSSSPVWFYHRLIMDASGNLIKGW